VFKCIQWYFLNCWYFNYYHSGAVINTRFDLFIESKSNWSSFWQFLYRWNVKLFVKFWAALNNDDSFYGVWHCHPEECLVLIVALLIPSWVGGSVLLSIICPASQTAWCHNPQDYLRLCDSEDECTTVLWNIGTCYQLIWLNISEGWNLQQQICDNIRSCNVRLLINRWI
jgi:hypothetical protein